MGIKIIALLASLISPVAMAQPAVQVEAARLTLSNYGISYCIKTMALDPAVKNEGNLALGAYFQNGSHDDPQAYANVTKAVDEYLKEQKNVYQQTGTPAVIPICLGLNQSTQYKKIVIQQDKWIGNL